jgi:hypothetical protein
MEVRIGQIGRIVQGDEAGCFVKVEDDTENTGGYLILTAKQPSMKDGYDNWVKDREALAGYFRESNWVIEWL